MSNVYSAVEYPLATKLQTVSPRLAAAAMLTSAGCWGSATVMTKGALVTFDPFILLAIQLSASVIVLWVAVFIFSVRLHRPKAMLIAGSTGVLEPGLAYAVGVPGLALTTASNASVIAALEPVFIFLGAWLLFQVRLDRFGIMAVVVAVIGITFVSLTDLSDLGDGSTIGDGLVLLGTAFAAVYVLASSKLAVSMPALLLTALQQTVGVVFVLGLTVTGLLMGWQVLPTSVSTPVLVLAVTSGLVQYALAFWLYMVGLQGIPVGLAGMFLTTTPVFGVLGGVMFLGESLVATQALGMVLVGIALISLMKRSKG